MPSTVSSCTGFLDDMQLDDPIVESRVMEIIMFAHRINQEAIGFMERGLEQLAVDRLEIATKAVIGLLANRPELASYRRRPPIVQSTPSNLVIISLPGSCRMTDTAFMLRILFSIEDVIAQSNMELLIAVVVYNLAFILHTRTLKDDFPQWKRTQDSRRAVQLYQVVRTLNTSFTLEAPVLEMAVLNNMGQLHYSNHEFQEMNDCWTILASLVNNLAQDFALLDVKQMRLNIQLKDRIDGSTPTTKKQRAA